MQSTPAIYSHLSRNKKWEMLSMFNLNFMSLVNQDNGAEMLRHILELSNLNGSDENTKLINAIFEVNYKKVIENIVVDGISSFCQGIEVKLIVNEKHFVGSSKHIFFSVIDQFINLYSTINSFTRLIVESHDT